MNVNPLKWLIDIKAEGVFCSGCHNILIARGPYGIPTSVELLLGVVGDHVKHCIRVQQYEDAIMPAEPKLDLVVPKRFGFLEALFNRRR